MASIGTEPKPTSLGVRHALLMFTAPRSVFDRVADTGAYGSALLSLLLMIVLLGYAEVQTGLIDREVDVQTEQKLETLEKTQGQLVDRIEFRDRMDSIRKEGTFLKLMTRLSVVVALPVYSLASFLLIASVLYAVVALTGRKPEYQTLMSICVFAGFVELTGYALRFAMVMYYRTTTVGTSLGALSYAGGPKFLSAIDPFHLWFWGLVAMGLVVTHQLSRRMAMASCSILALGAVGIRVVVAYSGSA